MESIEDLLASPRDGEPEDIYWGAEDTWLGDYASGDRHRNPLAAANGPHLCQSRGIGPGRRAATSARPARMAMNDEIVR